MLEFMRKNKLNIARILTLAVIFAAVGFGIARLEGLVAGFFVGATVGLVLTKGL